MGIVTKTKTWVDNENVTYTDLNADFDNVYNEFNGNVDNANIKVGAAIDPAKISGTAVTLAGTQTLTNKTLTSPIITGGDGWITSTDTFTYTSSNSFTITGVDRTAVYQKGTRIKLTDGATIKYFVVASSTFSTNTVVTITGGSDYSLSSSAITLPFYSYAVSPQGYPGFFNYTPTFGGFSVNPTVSMSRFCVVGNKCTVFHAESASGTSNDTLLNVSTPIAAKSITNADWSGTPAQTKDNGINDNVLGIVLIANGSANINVYRTQTFGQQWTATGAKQVYRFSIDYEI